jgi:hypothetical protein
MFTSQLAQETYTELQTLDRDVLALSGTANNFNFLAQDALERGSIDRALEFVKVAIAAADKIAHPDFAAVMDLQLSTELRAASNLVMVQINAILNPREFEFADMSFADF